MAKQMNTIFFTQSSSLDMFYRMALIMEESKSIDKVGFYITSSRFYEQFRAEVPEIEHYPSLKEWDIIRDSKGTEHDIATLRDYEKRLGQPVLWNALVADRRIYLGRRCSFAQDYASRFSHNRMLNILQLGIQRMEEFFDRVEPDFIVIFQCMTIGEYLGYLVAKNRGIQVLNLRPTRIRNYFYAVEHILEPSEKLQKRYEEFRKNGIPKELKQEATRCIEEVRDISSIYEGAVPVSAKPPNAVEFRQILDIRKVARRIRELIVGEWHYRFGKFRHDNHVSGYIEPFVYQVFVKRARAALMERIFRNTYVRRDDLPGLDYAFFPLHPEPEITVLVYSKPYINQLEAIRLISHNLPVGMKLVVKEHPWHVGKRTISYYRKLIAIPNVMLAHPAMKSRELVNHARLISVIAGSIAFEGLMMKKPAVVLGRAPFMFLPRSMIRHISNPDLLGNEIRGLLENHQHDEKALLSYIGAVMNTSVPVDFYTRLLKRRMSNNERVSDDLDMQEMHTRRLVEYLMTQTMKSSDHSTVNDSFDS